MLNNHEWQPVPGTTACQIYPLEREPDVKCSNTYIIQSKTAVLVIDPGADENSVPRIIQILEQAVAKSRRPIFVFLTHCHYDHFKNFSALQKQNLTPYLFVQETGAEAIQDGDKLLTLSYMYNENWLPRQADAMLATRHAQDTLAIQRILLSNGETVSLLAKSIFVNETNRIFCQTLKLGEEDKLEIYSTPGHSPDSLTFRLGALLFTGDLLLAANPGIAGAAGWNQEALLSSMQNISWLIASNTIQNCCPGHGKSISSGLALDSLRRTTSYVKKLQEVAFLDSDRIEFLELYAKELLDEISELFSVISGRLLAMAYILEEMTEYQEAQLILQKLDIDSIDRFLSDFNRYISLFKTNKQIPLEIPLKAIDIVMKIFRIFDDQHLKGFIDLSLIRRTKWLLISFMKIIQGVHEEILQKPEDINYVLLDIVSGLKKPKVNPRDLIDAVDQQDRFLQELVRRFAFHTIFDSVIIYFNTEIGLPSVMLERDRFNDMLTAIMEQIAAAGAETIRIEATYTPQDAVSISIIPSPLIDYFPFLERKIRFIQITFQLFSASVTYEKNPFGDRVVIQLPPALGWFHI